MMGFYTSEGRKILEELLNISEVEVNIRVGDTTPLCVAAKTGAINAARLILESSQGRTDPITINYRNKYGFTPLMRASEAGNIEIAQFLISRGAAKWLYNPPFQYPLNPEEETEPKPKNGEPALTLEQKKNLN